MTCPFCPSRRSQPKAIFCTFLLTDLPLQVPEGDAGGCERCFTPTEGAQGSVKTTLGRIIALLPSSNENVRNKLWDLHRTTTYRSGVSVDVDVTLTKGGHRPLFSLTLHVCRLLQGGETCGGVPTLLRRICPTIETFAADVSSTPRVSSLSVFGTETMARLHHRQEDSLLWEDWQGDVRRVEGLAGPLLPYQTAALDRMGALECNRRHWDRYLTRLHAKHWTGGGVWSVNGMHPPAIYTGPDLEATVGGGFLFQDVGMGKTVEVLALGCRLGWHSQEAGRGAHVQSEWPTHMAGLHGLCDPQGAISADWLSLSTSTVVGGNTRPQMYEHEAAAMARGDFRPHKMLHAGGTLVVVPPSLVTQWKAYISEWCTEDPVVVVYKGQKRHAAHSMQELAEADIVLTTPGVVQADVKRMLQWVSDVQCPRLSLPRDVSVVGSQQWIAPVEGSLVVMAVSLVPEEEVNFGDEATRCGDLWGEFKRRTPTCPPDRAALWRVGDTTLTCCNAALARQSISIADLPTGTALFEFRDTSAYSLPQKQWWSMLDRDAESNGGLLMDSPSYGMAHKTLLSGAVTTRLHGVLWNRVVVDEVHSAMTSNAKSQTFRAMRTLPTRNFWGLSATPRDTSWNASTFHLSMNRFLPWRVTNVLQLHGQPLFLPLVVRNTKEQKYADTGSRLLSLPSVSVVRHPCPGSAPSRAFLEEAQDIFREMYSEQAHSFGAAPTQVWQVMQRAVPLGTESVEARATREDLTLAALRAMHQPQRQRRPRLTYDELPSSEASRDDVFAMEACPVCMDGYVDGTILPCHHVFCYTCILTWMQTREHCPMCRRAACMGDLMKAPRGKGEEQRDVVEERAPVSLGGHTKAQVVQTLLHELRAKGEQTIVVTKHAYLLKDLMNVCAEVVGEPPVLVTATQSLEARQRKISAFVAGHHRVLVTSMNIVCNGLHLACANNIVLVEPPVHEAKYEQLIGRVHRLGQTKPVLVHVLCGGGQDHRAEALQSQLFEAGRWDSGSARRLLLQNEW